MGRFCLLKCLNLCDCITTHHSCNGLPAAAAIVRVTVGRCTKTISKANIMCVAKEMISNETDKLNINIWFCNVRKFILQARWLQVSIGERFNKCTKNDILFVFVLFVFLVPYDLIKKYFGLTHNKVLLGVTNTKFYLCCFKKERSLLLHHQKNV